MADGKWMMFNGDPDDVLELSALVGVRYKPMDTEGKDIAHSNMITVLDRQGRIHYQMKGFDESLQRVVAAIETAASGRTLAARSLCSRRSSFLVQAGKRRSRIGGPLEGNTKCARSISPLLPSICS